MLFWESCSDIYMRQLSSRGTRKRLDAAISVTGEGATARESVGCTSFSRGRLSYGGFRESVSARKQWSRPIWTHGKSEFNQKKKTKGKGGVNMIYLNTTTWEFDGFFSTKIGTRMSVSSSRKD